MAETTNTQPPGGLSPEQEQKAKDLWARVVAAGGMRAFVEARLKAEGLSLPPAGGDKKKKKKKAQKKGKGDAKREAQERAREEKSREVYQKIWAEVLTAYRALHLVHLGDSVFYTEKPAPDPKEPEDRAERLSRHDIPDYESPQALAEAMGLTISQLRWLCYAREVDTGTHYRTFTIPKRSGGRRTIRAPMPLLKKSQRWVLREILEKMPVHGAAQGFVAGASTLTNALPHAGASVVVKIDVKDFFPTISFARVKGMFRAAGFREPVAIVLALLCTEPPREEIKIGGRSYYVATGEPVLPQGAPTSPYITNIICRRLDRRLRGWCTKAGWTYTRYADDLTFSYRAGKDAPGHGKVASLISKVRQILEAEGFSVNEEKTRIMRRGRRQRVTGLVVNELNPSGEVTPRVPREFRRRLRAAIHRKTLEEKVGGVAGLESARIKQSALAFDASGFAPLMGMAAYIAMTDYDQGEGLLRKLGELKGREEARASHLEAGE